MTETQNPLVGQYDQAATVGTGKAVHKAHRGEGSPGTRCGAEWKNGRSVYVRIVRVEVTCRRCIAMSDAN